MLRKFYSPLLAGEEIPDEDADREEHEEDCQSHNPLADLPKNLHGLVRLVSRAAGDFYDKRVGRRCLGVAAWASRSSTAELS